MKFTRLSTPIKVPEHQLSALGQLYPHGLWDYEDLAREARSFLARSFSTSKPYMEVVGITNHNGYGRQWGIILFHYPYDGNNEWKVVAQFGHGLGDLKLRILFARWLSRFLQHKNQELKHPRRLESLTQS